MILGIGCDSVDFLRIKSLLDRFREKFVQKILSPEERRTIKTKNVEGYRFIPILAKRFAVKEACFKAIGTGMCNGVSWHDVCVQHTALGAPILSLSGQTLQNAKFLMAQHSFSEPVALFPWVSLTDTPDTATAMVVLEAGVKVRPSAKKLTDRIP